MNIMNLYVYENRSMSNDLLKPIMLENLNVDNVQIHIPKEIGGTDMGTWAWWFVYQNAKREKYSIPMTLEGTTSDDGEEEYISTVGLNHGFTGKHGTVMYAIEAIQADGSGAVTHEWHTKTYKLEIVYTLQGNQTEYDESESDIISALISRVNELIQSGAEIAEIAETIEHAAETAQEVIDSIPADYSELSNRVGANTIALAEKADQATTYTKTQVDQMIADVEVETDTTLEVAGAPADAAETGRQIGLLKADLGAVQIADELTDYTISQGTINGTYGYNSDSNTRCRTGFFEFLGERIVITPKDGYKISGRTYSGKTASSEYYIEGSGWTTGALQYSDASKYYRMVIAKADDSAITPETLPEDVISITYYNNTDKTLTLDGKSADAGIVGRRMNAFESELGVFKIEEILTEYTIEQGTINATDGSEGSSLSTNRARTGFIFFDGDKLNVVPKEGYAVGGRIYSENSIDSFVSSDSFTTDQLEYTNANYYRFVIKKVDGSDIPIQSLPDDVITITYYSDTDRTLSVTGKIADAGIVGKRIRAIEDERQGIVGRNNPIETVQLLQQLNRKTRISGSTYGKAPLCFIHFSDIHGDATCLVNVIEFKSAYANYIKDILHTGDAVHYSSVDGMNFWDGVEGAENVLNVIGNHDTKLSPSGDWTGLSMAESYSAYFAPYISNWGCTYTADKTYYYKDYVTEGVRLIVLDIMHQTAEQLAWFVSTLESARTAGLDVVIGVHSRAHWLLDTHDGVWDDKINAPSYSEGYSDTSAYTGSNYPSNLADDYASAVDDFIEAGGYFIAWLHGHTHFRILADLQTHSNQLDIAVANAGGAGFAHTYVWERVVDTKSMDDFNVVGIDTTGKILRIAKIGVNTDRFMRVAHTMSYNYSTHTIIHAG